MHAVNRLDDMIRDTHATVFDLQHRPAQGEEDETGADWAQASRALSSWATGAAPPGGVSVFAQCVVSADCGEP
jgi:hypothetical protein